LATDFSYSLMAHVHTHRIMLAFPLHIRKSHWRGTWV